MLLDKKEFEPHQVNKADDTGVGTAQATKEIIAGKGKEFVGSVTYNESGILVTVSARD
jgi:hypothetical protein